MGEEEFILREIGDVFIAAAIVVISGADAGVGFGGERAMENNLVEGRGGLGGAMAKACGGVGVGGVVVVMREVIFYEEPEARVIGAQGFEVGMEVEVRVCGSDEFVAVDGEDPIGVEFIEGALDEVIGEGGLEVDGILGAVEGEGEAFSLEGEEDIGCLVVAAVVGDEVVIDESGGMADEGFDDVFFVPDDGDSDEAGAFFWKDFFEDAQGGDDRMGWGVEGRLKGAGGIGIACWWGGGM